MTQLISDRVFDNMVNADLRDKHGTGFAWEVLRAPINRVRWMTALVGIRESLNAQNAHENAALKAHPEHPGRGGPTPPAYAAAKAEYADRRRVRMRLMQAVKERITEAEQLIGTLPVSQVSAGRWALELVEVDRVLGEARFDDARVMVQGLLRSLTANEGAHQ